LSDVAFISRGLRAHKNATKKMVATEQQFGIRRDPVIISAIRKKSVLEFTYNGRLRVVEPQTYGLSTAGREVLRAYERPERNGRNARGLAKLFDLKKISNLREIGENFAEALAVHNPDDRAMVEIFATLRAPRD
jgi:predicted DNA-binding transcriptional regulator YafY